MEDNIIAVAAVILSATTIKLIKKRKKVFRRVWTGLRVQRRTVHGAHIALMHGLYLEDPSTIDSLVRIDKHCFAELLSMWSLKYTNMHCLIYTSK